MRVDEGLGWRLGFDPEREPFNVLIGGASWAVDLTAHEAMALATGVARLRRQHEQIADQLLDQADLELDWECDNLWVGLTLHRGCWSLRFVLEGSAGRRSVEGGWDDAASQALALALEAMTSQLSAERSND